MLQGFTLLFRLIGVLGYAVAGYGVVVHMYNTLPYIFINVTMNC